MKKILYFFFFTIILILCSSYNIKGQGSHCFASDPGMGSTNPNDHYSWAQSRDASQLEANVKSKINLLYKCPSVSDNAFAAAFADLSVVIAQYAQKVNCFNNDPGAINPNRSSHYDWAKTKSRFQVFENLHGKITAAFKCLDSKDQKTFFADVSVLIAQVSPTNQTGGNNNTNNQGKNNAPGEWRVWFKTSPCSGRFDWISVAKENPTEGGGGNFYYLANQIFPGTPCTTEGCTFAVATTVAASLRTSPQFSNYCCHDYSVWKNRITGKMSVVVGKFGTAGNDWDFVKGNLCCEEAEALSGIPGACSGTIQTNQPNVQNTKCGPGSYAAVNLHTKKVVCYCNPGLVWNTTRTACVEPPPTQVNCMLGSHAAVNPQTQKVECYCNTGLVWNSTKTACVDPEELVKNADCSIYPGSKAFWNAEKQKVECRCPEGKVWNSTMTECVDEASQVNCWPGSYAAVNPQTQKTECYCNPGLVWNSTKTACVDPQELVRAADCSVYPGSYPAWNSQTQKVECLCPTGKKWNSTMTACIDFVDNNNNETGPISAPDVINECEGGFCGTWTRQGNKFNAVWSNGAKATLTIEHFDNKEVIITRNDLGESISKNFSAKYTGKLSGNQILEGKVTYTQNGRTWYGTWTASW